MLVAVASLVLWLGCAQGVLLTEPDRNYPFVYGVSSADPLTDSILIWTAIDPALANLEYNVSWSLWDPRNGSFASPLFSGSRVLNESADYTMMVQVDGLDSNTKYEYQFQHVASGNLSMKGYTKTLPLGSELNSSSVITLAITSCTSILEGYFHLYESMATNDDIDLVLHLGDFAYPLYDRPRFSCSPILCANPGRDSWFGSTLTVENQDPYVSNLIQSLDSDGPLLHKYRWVQKYYRMKPRLRAAKQVHPWITLHDDDDIIGTNANFAGFQAYLEWNPMRYSVDASMNVNTNRNFQIGNLVDIITLDTRQRTTENSTLGPEQEAWFENAINASVAKDTKWRAIITTVQFSPIALNIGEYFLNVTFGSTLAVALALAIACFVGKSYVAKRDENAASLLSKGDEQEDSFLRAKIMKHTLAGPRWMTVCSFCCLFLFVLSIVAWTTLSVHFLGYVLNRFASDGEYSENEVLFIPSDSSWGGRNGGKGYESQNLMFEQLERQNADSNNVWVSGDSHLTVLADVIAYDRFNFDSLDSYDPGAPPGRTNKRYGVEFNPTSGTGDNFDEVVWDEVGWPIGTFKNSVVSQIANYVLARGNRQYRYFNGIDHGHGILRISEESVVGELWYANVRDPDSRSRVAKTMVVHDQENRWSNP